MSRPVGWQAEAAYQRAETRIFTQRPHLFRPDHSPVAPGDKFTYEVPDMFGRPWAKSWEEYLERQMARPRDERDPFAF